MIYVMSDIHGRYDKFVKMLDKINFSEDDTLYILGDSVDRGEDGIAVLRDMAQRENVVPILGNHDFMAYNALKRLNVEITEDSIDAFDIDAMRGVNEWLLNGGTPTMKAFSKLDKEEKEELLEYIADMEVYEEVELNGKEYILVHAALGNFEKDKPLWEYPLGDLIFGRMDYDRVYFEDKYIVTGHIPTVMIDEDYRGRILMKNNHICIDCGAFMLDTLGCLCLDTMEEYYV